MTSLDLTTSSKILAPEDKPRSRMAVVLAVGVGVAAAAFLVKPLPPLLVASFVLTRMRRDERA